KERITVTERQGALHHSEQVPAELAGVHKGSLRLQLSEGRQDQLLLRRPAAIHSSLADPRSLCNPLYSQRLVAHLGQFLESRVENRLVRPWAAGTPWSP